MISRPARHRASQLGWTTEIPELPFPTVPALCTMSFCLHPKDLLPTPSVLKSDSLKAGLEGTLEVTPSHLLLLQPKDRK